MPHSVPSEKADDQAPGKNAAFLMPPAAALSSSGTIAPALAKAATHTWSTVDTSGGLPLCTAVSNRCWYSG